MIIDYSGCMSGSEYPVWTQTPRVYIDTIPTRFMRRYVVILWALISFIVFLPILCFSLLFEVPIGYRILFLYDMWNEFVEIFNDLKDCWNK